MSEFNRETMGRVALAEISVYDAMMQEIATDKEIRIRKFLRKHEVRSDGHPVKKDKRKSYQKEKCYSCDPWNGLDVVKNVRIAEKIRTDAEDWNIELENIAEYAMWEKINFDVETERLKALGAWLEWA